MEYNQQKDREAHFQSLALQSPSVNQIHANGSIVKSKKATGTKSIGNSSQIKCKEDSVLMIDDKIMKDVEDRCSITSSLSSYQSCDNNNENNDSNENIVPSAANNNFINNGTHRRDKNESEVENVEEDEEKQLIQLTMEQSKRDHDEYERRRQMEEDEIIYKVLKLSMIEK